MEINIEIKTTTTAVIKNVLKYFPMSAEPNLEVSFFSLKVLKTDVWSDDNFLKCYYFTIR